MERWRLWTGLALVALLLAYHALGELTPAGEDWFLEQGRATLERGDLPWARAFMQAAILWRPGAAAGHEALATVRLEEGAADDAARSVQRACLLDRWNRARRTLCGRAECWETACDGAGERCGGEAWERVFHLRRAELLPPGDPDPGDALVCLRRLPRER